MTFALSMLRVKGRARYYTSSMGRWMSPDYSMNSVIMELPQSWNKYSYVYNRSTYATDPDGRCPPCVGAIVGGIVEGGFDLGKQLYHNGGNLNLGKKGWEEVGANLGYGNDSVQNGPFGDFETFRHFPGGAALTSCRCRAVWRSPILRAFPSDRAA